MTITSWVVQGGGTDHRRRFQRSQILQAKN
jgi:hypothetical protein